MSCLRMCAGSFTLQRPVHLHCTLYLSSKNLISCMMILNKTTHSEDAQQRSARSLVISLNSTHANGLLPKRAGISHAMQGGTGPYIIHTSVTSNILRKLPKPANNHLHSCYQHYVYRQHQDLERGFKVVRTQLTSCMEEESC